MFLNLWLLERVKSKLFYDFNKAKVFLSEVNILPELTITCQGINILLYTKIINI